MIPYEELCQSLDRFNARRRNEAELAGLDQVPQEPAAMEQPPPADPYHATQPEAHDTAPGSTDPDVGQRSDDGFAQQAPEDTHEIDVDDVLVDERLSEDKIPGE